MGTWRHARRITRTGGHVAPQSCHSFTIQVQSFWTFQSLFPSATIESGPAWSHKTENMFKTTSFQIKRHPIFIHRSKLYQMLLRSLKPAPPFIHCFIVLSSAVWGLFWFQSNGPGVGRHNVSPAMDSAGINTLIELVGDDAKVSVLHDNVAGDGGQDLFTIFIPAGGNSHSSDLYFILTSNFMFGVFLVWSIDQLTWLLVVSGGFWFHSGNPPPCHGVPSWSWRWPAEALVW